MEDNVKTFLDKIQDLGDQSIKVFVGSLKEEISCLNLTFKQQKDLIGTIGDGAIGALKFQKVLNDIIIKNTDNTNILVTDKLAITIKMRIDSIGGKIIRDDDEIDLLSLLDTVKKIKPISSRSINGSVKVDLKVPTLREESKIIQSAIDNIKKDESEFGKNIGNIYTYEIVKYIDKISFGEDILELIKIPIKDRFKIVENLPISINKDIIAFIQELKTSEKDALTYNTNKVLDIDVSFFDS